MVNDKICYFNNQKEKIEVTQGIVYVNDSKVKEIGQGVDGIVYKYNDKAIKLYHDDIHIKLHLNKNEIDRLRNLYTKKITLPREILINNETVLGFTMNYVDITAPKDILSSDKNYIINKIKELEEELILLGKNNFLLEDTKPENLFYNGNLYMFDPDSFIYEKNFNASNENLKVFAYQFFRYMVSLLNQDMPYPQYLAYIRKINYLYKKGNYISLSEFLEDVITQNLTEIYQIEPLNQKTKTLHKHI